MLLVDIQIAPISDPPPPLRNRLNRKQDNCPLTPLVNMSFRELRNFTEMMRALGYPRLISVQNFRVPNFELVADCLYWMVKRYIPEMTISDVIDSEQDRVDFVTGIAQLMAVKARIKLNTKKLYAADGHAVRELIKIAEQLYKATRVETIADGEGEDDVDSTSLTTKLKDLKTTRALASEITDRGAKLHDLLGSEPQLRDARMKALRFLDSISGNLNSTSEHKYIEKSIRELISNVGEQATSLERQCGEMETDEKALDAKIKKRQTELERQEKRLRGLQTLRPAFMDEYEKLEAELQKQYATYLLRFRNLDYLEHELDMYNQSEREKLEESERSLKRMQDRLRREELDLLRGKGDLLRGDKEAQKRPSAANSRRVEGGVGKGGKGGGGGGGGGRKDRRGSDSSGRGRMAGSMVGGSDDESESDLSDDVGSGSGSGSDGASDDEVSLGGSSGSGSGSGSDGDLIDDDDDDSHITDEEEGAGYNFDGDSDNEF